MKKSFWTWLKCLIGLHKWKTEMNLAVWIDGTEPYCMRVEGFICRNCEEIEIINDIGRRVPLPPGGWAVIPPKMITRE